METAQTKENAVVGIGFDCGNMWVSSTNNVVVFKVIKIIEWFPVINTFVFLVYQATTRL